MLLSHNEDSPQPNGTQADRCLVHFGPVRYEELDLKAQDGPATKCVTIRSITPSKDLYIMSLQVGQPWPSPALVALFMAGVGGAKVIMIVFLIASYSQGGNLQIKHLHEQGS